MGRRGPKAKPTALKILQGAQPCRINYDEPAYPEAVDLEPPEWLSTLAQEHWRELAPILQRARVFTDGDRAALAQLCDDYSTIRHSIDPPECEVEDPKRIRSLLANADRARERYRRMLVEFGLTPSSRSRIKVAPEKPVDDLGEFLGKKAQ